MTATISNEVVKDLTKDEITQYLTSKNITVETIDKVSAVKGMYEINAAAKDSFYINQDKKIFFGMIVDLDTGKNITLEARQNPNFEIDITNGHLSPMKMEQITDQGQQVIPVMETPEDYEKLIKNMEETIKGLRLQQQQKTVPAH